MSKQTSNQGRKKSGPVVFTNSAGDEFKILPMNPLEDELIRKQILGEWKAAGRALPEFPTYEAKNAAGETVRMQIRKAEDADTPELQAAWAAYEQAEREFNGEYGNRFMVSVFLCIDAKPEDYPLWARRMRLLKIDLPADEDERFVTFCQTWVIRSTDDLADLVFAASSTVATVSEEARAAAEARFRGVLEKSYAAAVAGSDAG